MNQPKVKAGIVVNKSVRSGHPGTTLRVILCILLLLVMTTVPVAPVQANMGFHLASAGRTGAESIHRSINGSSNSSTLSFDAISRVTSIVNPLGTFNLSYVDNTSGSSKGDPRLSSISYPNGNSSPFAYLPNIADQRLQQIVNQNSTPATLSQFNYAYSPAGEIRQWQQLQNSTNSQFGLDYDLAGQLSAAVSDSGSKSLHIRDCQCVRRCLSHGI